MSETNNNAGSTDTSNGVSQDSSSNEEYSSQAEPRESESAAPVASAQAALKKKFKIKVDQKEEDVEIDLNNEEELKRHIQMSRAAQKRMQEAATTRKQAEDFIKMLQTDPISVLTNPNLGVDFRRIAEDYLYKQIVEEQLTPEQKRLQEAERIIKEREEEVKRKREDSERSQMEQLQNHYAQDFDKKITEALKSSNLPKTPKTVRRMAELMHRNLSHGLELEPSQLVEFVRQDYLNEIKELFGNTEGDILMSLMGDDIANKLRKADLARIKGVNPFKQPVNSQPQEDKPVKRMSKDEWREMMDKKIK
jgi:hypothetical protein